MFHSFRRRIVSVLLDMLGKMDGQWGANLLATRNPTKG